MSRSGLAHLGSKENSGRAHMFDEIPGRDDDGLGDYDVPPPAVSVRKVEQFVREQEIEAASESRQI